MLIPVVRWMRGDGAGAGARWRQVGGLARLLASLLLLASLGAAAQTPRDGLVESLRAVDFRQRTGGLMPIADMLFYGNGAIGTDGVVIPDDTSPTRFYNVDVVAYATPAGPSHSAYSWPLMEVYFDGIWIGSVHVTSRSPTVYRLPVTQVSAGLHKLEIVYANDAIEAGEDRNLYVRRVDIRMGAAPAIAGRGGSFELQSVSILNGFYPSNELHYGLAEPCDPSLTGCRNIELIRHLGATDVTFTSVCTLQPGANWCAPQINYNNEEAALRVAIRHARSLGLTVSLKPFVLAPNGEVLATYEAPGSTRKWLPANPYEFFDSIEANLLRHAEIAREEGVSLLMVGAEFGGRFTSGLPMGGYGDWCPRWRQMIAKARSVAANATPLVANPPPAVALTYSATFAGYWNDVDANEAPYVCFWDAMDYIGINAYPHMNLPAEAVPSARLGTGFSVHRRMFLPLNANDSDSDDFAIAEGSQHDGVALNFEPEVPGFEAFDLRDAGPGGYQARFNTRLYSSRWATDFVIDRLNEKFAASLRAQNKYPLKAILTEVGVPSGRRVHGFWGDNDQGARQPGDEAYLDEQQRGWDGYLRAFYGNPRIVGLSVWGLMPHHDAAYGTVEGWELSYDFNGKPKAAEAICQWFKRGWRRGTCVGP